ncbi:hypothetical protein LTR95_006210 [Oleoguttula sp. CCFEE 5521]
MADHYLLLQAYRTLTFRFQNSPDDHSRFEAFKLLVIRHLLSFEFIDYYGKAINSPKFDLTTWEDAANKHKFLYSFITTHGQKLWPGKIVERSHLASPAVRTNDSAYKRSFVAGYDGKWSGNRNKPGAGRKKNMAVPQDEFELAGMSCIGRALQAYVEVLIADGLARESRKLMQGEEALVVLATAVDSVKWGKWKSEVEQ